MRKLVSHLNCSSQLIVPGKPECSYVCANIQGGDDKKCPYYHESRDKGQARGDLISIRDCPVKYWFFIPKVNGNGIPSTNHLVILSKGEHNHPPPPLQRIDVSMVHAGTNQSGDDLPR